MWAQRNKRDMKVEKIASVFRFPDDLLNELMQEVSLAVDELGGDKSQLEQWLGVNLAKAA